MLGNIDASANLAVKDLDRAKQFYEGVLGLMKADTMGDELIVYKSGGTNLNVYKSKEAGTNKATAVTWGVGDRIEDTVDQLKAKGVRFEHYDMPGMTLKGDIHEGEGMKVAWFKDPDGNILNLTSE